LWSLKWISHEYFIKWTKYPFKKGYGMPRCGIMVIKPYVIWFGYAILKALYAYLMPQIWLSSIIGGGYYYPYYIHPSLMPIYDVP
jgi:hypothetical protein